MQIDTGAEINLCGASWLPMLQLAGAELSSHPLIKVGWVPKVGGGFHSTFKVTPTLEIILQIVGFGWQYLIQFHVASDRMVLYHLVCGWPVLRKEWGCIMKNSPESCLPILCRCHGSRGIIVPCSADNASTICRIYWKGSIYLS